MDKARKPAKNRRRWLLVSLGLALLLIVLLVNYRSVGPLSVEGDRLTVATVTQDPFYEYINVTGRIEPGAIYFIDSKVTGNVERIYAESGQSVVAGDTLLRVSNADLELQVMERESQLLEQLNAQRQTRLLLNQNDFVRREQLVEIDYQLALRGQQFRRDTQLMAEGLLAVQDYEPTANQYAYYRERRDLLSESYRRDSSIRSRQLSQIDAFEDRILLNLQRVRGILDRLYVKAATNGKLGDFTVRAGQAITNGQRLGEVFQMTTPLIVAEVDEFYLDRVDLNQPGLLLDRGDTVGVTVTKIYPNVEAGRFRVEMNLDHPAEEDFFKGQSVRVRLLFGLPEPTLQLATGNFFGSSGGHFVYRIEGDGAVRTPVKLGRSNPNFHEVLEGLLPGDRIVTSSYEAFGDHQKIKIN